MPSQVLYEPVLFLDPLQKPFPNPNPNGRAAVYLDLSRNCYFSLFFLSFRLLSWFLNEGKWFVHGWRVVHVGRKRAGRAGSGTPCRRWTLRPVEHGWCWYRPVIAFAVDLAQCPFPSETQRRGRLSVFDKNKKKFRHI